MMELSPEVKIGFFFLMIIGIVALGPIIWPTWQEDLRRFRERLATQKIRQEKLPDRFDQIEKLLLEYIKVSEHLSKKSREVEDRVKGLEDWSKTADQDLFDRTFSSKSSQSSDLTARDHPPISAARIPQNSDSDALSEDWDSEPESGAQDVDEALQILEKMKKNWSNAKAEDRDRAMGLLDKFLTSRKQEAPF